MVPLCLAATACSRAADEDTLGRVRAGGTLRVALTTANPPWNFLDGAARPVGYDVDVAREVARRIGVRRVTFIGADFASFVGGIRADRFDVVIAGQSVTAKRRREVDFSRPYALNGVAVFVRRGDRSISGVKDLAGKRVAVSEGTVQAEFARDRVRDAKVKTYRNATLVLTDLSWGRADAALVSRFQGIYLAAEKGLAITPVGPVWRTYPLSMSFRKHSPAFRHALDTAISDMIGDGTLSAISRRWLGGLDMAAELRGLPPDPAARPSARP
ncbi:transporter substrate-binding domain-containing protein [Actinomadura alba]|uniref:Transporter substrate-binding domain-containing protein n=2 Tax=Actinomadura alba TaxID=406431 RepID=A0ABR7M1W8_9ACTN|nr:transporter substrate-binding domain-containing protein [Actinomadura alba]